MKYGKHLLTHTKKKYTIQPFIAYTSIKSFAYICARTQSHILSLIWILSILSKNISYAKIYSTNFFFQLVDSAADVTWETWIFGVFPVWVYRGACEQNVFIVESCHSRTHTKFVTCTHANQLLLTPEKILYKFARYCFLIILYKIKWLFPVCVCVYVTTKAIPYLKCMDFYSKTRAPTDGKEATNFRLLNLIKLIWISTVSYYNKSEDLMSVRARAKGISAPDHFVFHIKFYDAWEIFNPAMYYGESESISFACWKSNIKSGKPSRWRCDRR